MINYGYQIRSCFIAAPGKILVGCDLDGIEARIAGHYTLKYDNGSYAETVINGDVHQDTAEKLDITRDQAKTFNYAVLYGCGAKRVQDMLDVKYGVAKRMLETYWRSNPGLTKLKENLELSLTRRGVDLSGDLLKQRAYVLSLGGRRIYIDKRHSLVNSLFQSAACTVFKRWYIEVSKKLPTGAKIVLAVHDELLLEVNQEDVEHIIIILKGALDNLRGYFNLNVDITGTSIVGNNWWECH